MLSEHETLELLEQLKLGVIPGTAGISGSEVDTVGHWPALIGGGMCLNLQAVAALELNTQPENIHIMPSIARLISCADLASRYQQVHHLSTGIDGRTLVIAYDHEFSSMLSLLQETEYHSRKEYFGVADQASPEAKLDAASRQYEFSQAIATSIDPGPSTSGQLAGLSFLTLDAEELHLAASWQLKLEHRNIESVFLVGLVNSHFDNSIVEPFKAAETFSIEVRPERVCRTNGLNALVAELCEPEVITIEKTQDCGKFPVGPTALNSRTGESGDQRELSVENLLVQRMLQLSVDDLYLLMIEAIGRATVLTFSFELEPTTRDPAHFLREGCTHRCLSVNGLPVRQAWLAVSDGKCLLESHE